MEKSDYISEELTLYTHGPELNCKNHGTQNINFSALGVCSKIIQKVKEWFI